MTMTALGCTALVVGLVAVFALLCNRLAKRLDRFEDPYTLNPEQYPTEDNAGDVMHG